MQILNNHSLKSRNTFGISCNAKFFAEFSSLPELVAILDSSAFKLCNQHLILGGGSNILFTQDFDGFVLKNNLKGIELIFEDENYYYLKAYSGEIWHRLVEYCVERDWCGIENLSLIPGTVGAAPIQNIGAYGVELADVFYELEAIEINTQKIKKISLNDCGFGYRESVFKGRFKNQFIIINITIKLNKAKNFQVQYGAIKEELAKMNVTEPNVKTISQAIINIRTSKLPNPVEIGNAGSFFKNPTIDKLHLNFIQETYPNIPFYASNANFKIAAGWLIEQCGFKGYRINDAGCHAKQALVLVNYGNATGKEILDLSEQIIVAVNDKFKIKLEREVNIY